MAKRILGLPFGVVPPRSRPAPGQGRRPAFAMAETRLDQEELAEGTQRRAVRTNRARRAKSAGANRARVASTRSFTSSRSAANSKPRAVALRTALQRASVVSVYPGGNGVRGPDERPPRTRQARSHRRMREEPRVVGRAQRSAADHFQKARPPAGRIHSGTQVHPGAHGSPRQQELQGERTDPVIFTGRFPKGVDDAIEAHRHATSGERSRDLSGLIQRPLSRENAMRRSRACSSRRSRFRPA